MADRSSDPAEAGHGLTAERYRPLIEREAAHWGQVDADPENPQLWDDPGLYELVLAPPYRHLVDRAARGHQAVLELGCGGGDLVLELARRGISVTGIDLSPERIARASEASESHGLANRTRFVADDLSTAVLPRRAFDCVVAHDALHHVMGLDHLLAEVHEALLPGGAFLVSDFIGASHIEKLMVAVLYATLPTVQPYAKKWRLRGRLRAFLASERRKRQDLEQGRTASLHDASPFEGISQESIIRRVARRFRIVELYTFCPYWYHLVPKLRMSSAMRKRLLGAAQSLDLRLHRLRLTRGCYVFIEAKRAGDE